ncbi:MAG TPA: hypothetical protein VFA40_11520 [Terriglobales bacterium]|nr:hypothetical protein [Terriglobales bacterium]
MKRSLSCLLIVVLLVAESAMGVNADQAVYVGGTANLKQGTKGILDAANEKIIKFDVWETPYDRITALDYGQHVGRHWGYAVLGLYGVLPILLAKKRHHFLTVEYSDDAGKTQAAIFEVGKESIRSVLKVLEVRSGKKVQYEDKEAEKTGNK